MKLNEYQKLSERTANRHENELLNYGLGLTGEAGEVADLIKKSQFHGHSVSAAEIKNELGDVLWYLSRIASLADLSLEEVAQANIDKLAKRYPEGFSVTRSKNRNDVEELK